METILELIEKLSRAELVTLKSIIEEKIYKCDEIIVCLQCGIFDCQRTTDKTKSCDYIACTDCGDPYCRKATDKNKKCQYDPEDRRDEKCDDRKDSVCPECGDEDCKDLECLDEDSCSDCGDTDCPHATDKYKGCESVCDGCYYWKNICSCGKYPRACRKCKNVECTCFDSDPGFCSKCLKNNCQCDKAV